MIFFFFKKKPFKICFIIQKIADAKKSFNDEEKVILHQSRLRGVRTVVLNLFLPMDPRKLKKFRGPLNYQCVPFADT